MIIHYRTYLQFGITNTFAMLNNFYSISNQIQTPFYCYFRLHHQKWMCCYSMVINLKTPFLSHKMIIHYRTYLPLGITNTFAMPNIFYSISNQIQTPFKCYFRLHHHKWMCCYNMVFKLKDTEMIIHYRTYLQLGISNTFAMPNNFYTTKKQVQTPFNYYFRLHHHKWMCSYNMVIKLMDTVPVT